MIDPDSEYNNSEYQDDDYENNHRRNQPFYQITKIFSESIKDYVRKNQNKNLTPLRIQYNNKPDQAF